MLQSETPFGQGCGQLADGFKMDPGQANGGGHGNIGRVVVDKEAGLRSTTRQFQHPFKGLRVCFGTAELEGVEAGVKAPAWSSPRARQAPAAIFSAVSVKRSSNHKPL